MGRKAEVRFPVDCRVRPPPPPRGTGKDGALPSVDHIGDRDRWSLCRMEYGVYAGGGHACMPLWNADGEFANGESARTDAADGRKAAFAIGSRVASSFPLCCPTNLGLPDTAPGNKFETSVVGPKRPSTR